jgi:hypothetical protein
MTPRVLVAGWFSFPWMGATAGDLIAARVVCAWLAAAAVPHDVAISEALRSATSDAVDWERVDPAAYSHAVFVCGPLGDGEPFTSLHRRFRDVTWIGMNLSMLRHLEQWNPFDVLIERDSDRDVNPDLTFAAPPAAIPVVGVVLVHPQREYPDGRHEAVQRVIDESLATGRYARVAIDTCFDPPNTTGLRTAAEVESVISRMDAIVTTRLHGLVLALKSGVPAVAVDPIVGGAKITKQVDVLEWPALVAAERCDAAAIEAALVWCLTEEARALARRVASRARDALERVLRPMFLDVIQAPVGDAMSAQMRD